MTQKGLIHHRTNQPTNQPGATSPGEIWPWSYGNKGVLRILKSTSITIAFPSDFCVIIRTLVRVEVLPLKSKVVSVFERPILLGSQRNGLKYSTYMLVRIFSSLIIYIYIYIYNLLTNSQEVAVKWFQVLQSRTNDFIYTQLNGLKYCYLFQFTHC